MVQITLDTPSIGGLQPGDQVTGAVRLTAAQAWPDSIRIQLRNVEVGELMRNGRLHDKVLIPVDEQSPSRSYRFELTIPVDAVPAFSTDVGGALPGGGELSRHWEIQAAYGSDRTSQVMAIDPVPAEVGPDQLIGFDVSPTPIVGRQPGTRRESLVSLILGLAMVVVATMLAWQDVIGPGWAIIVAMAAVLPAGYAAANESLRRDRARFEYGNEQIHLDRVAYRLGDTAHVTVHMASQEPSICFLRLSEMRPIRHRHSTAEAGSYVKDDWFELWRSVDSPLRPGPNRLQFTIPSDQLPTYIGDRTMLEWEIQARVIADDEDLTDDNPKTVFTVLP